MMSNKMFIAVEVNSNGSVNDIGRVAQTKEKAWNHVKYCFSPKDTEIWELIPRFKVKVPSNVQFVAMEEDLEPLDAHGC